MTDGLAGQQQTSASDSHRPLPGEVRASGEPWRESSSAAFPLPQISSGKSSSASSRCKKRRGPAWQPAKQHPGKGRRQLNAGEPGHYLPQPAPFAGE